MSRPVPAGRQSSITRKGYGALAVEDLESSDSEPEVVVVQLSEPAPVAPPALIQRSDS